MHSPRKVPEKPKLVRQSHINLGEIIFINNKDRVLFIQDVNNTENDLNIFLENLKEGKYELTPSSIKEN